MSSCICIGQLMCICIGELMCICIGELMCLCIGEYMYMYRSVDVNSASDFVYV